MDFLQNHIEALIFCSPSPIRMAEIKACLTEMFNADVPEEDILGAIERLEEKYASDEYAFQLFKAAGGYQFLTKPAYQASISIMLKQQSKKRLSTSAMETLAIVAYKQPIAKTELENIRGVNCDYAVQRLLDKGLIEITGKADTIGRPMLYGTTAKFMEYFGISELTELPVPKDFSAEVNTIGEDPEARGSNEVAVESLADGVENGGSEQVSPEESQPDTDLNAQADTEIGSPETAVEASETELPSDAHQDEVTPMNSMNDNADPGQSEDGDAEEPRPDAQT